MIKRSFRLWLGAILVVATLACGSLGAEPTALPPTATSQPTATPAPPTATPAPPTETPTPEDTATPTFEELLPLSPKAYEHPSQAFTISLPEGWEAVEYSNSMYAAPSGGAMFMAASFENVGVVFDDAMLDTYITAFGANWWGSFEGYNANKPEAQSNGSWVVTAYLVGENNTPMAVISYYWRVGQIIYTTDFGMPYDQYDTYAPVFAALSATLKVDANSAAKAPLYQTLKTFNQPKGLFQLSFPISWAYTHAESDSGAILSDSFTSPDGQSAILLIAYDDGTKISKSTAGQFALSLLRDAFKIQNIKITDDKVQADGSERLTWTSPGLDGITFFEIHGTAFVMISWIVNEGSYDLFFPVWDEILKTYSVAQ